MYAHTEDLHKVKFKGAFIDTNMKENKYSSKIGFEIEGDQTNVDGYYLSISTYSFETPGELPIYQIYIPKVNSKEYSWDLEDIDLKGIRYLDVTVGPVIEGKLNSGNNIRTFDNPKNEAQASIEGLKIHEFKDINNKKGSIKGKIRFDKATDEKDIFCYSVELTTYNKYIYKGRTPRIFILGVLSFKSHSFTTNTKGAGPFMRGKLYP